MNLTDIATQHGSDKGAYGEAHRYTSLYQMLLQPFVDREFRLLEMGLQIGGPEMKNDKDRRPTDIPSVKMWQSYLKSVHVTGLDISDFSEFENERFDFIQCDMNDRKALAKIRTEQKKSKKPQFDMILDDGAHASAHQQNAFLEFFPTLLKPGGLYIIEDLHWQPSRMEKENGDPTKTAELFWGFIKSGTFRHVHEKTQSEFNEMIDGISFAYVFKKGYRPRGPDKVLVVHKAI